MLGHEVQEKCRYGRGAVTQHCLEAQLTCVENAVIDAEVCRTIPAYSGTTQASHGGANYLLRCRREAVDTVMTRLAYFRVVAHDVRVELKHDGWAAIRVSDADHRRGPSGHGAIPTRPSVSPLCTHPRSSVCHSSMHRLQSSIAAMTKTPVSMSAPLASRNMTVSLRREPSHVTMYPYEM